MFDKDLLIATIYKRAPVEIFEFFTNALLMVEV